jgi:hypothetical protein
MANTPRNKAATKEAIQAANPLNAPDFGSNLGTENDKVPDEFRLPAAHLGAEVLTAAGAAGGEIITNDELAQFRQWQADNAMREAAERVAAEAAAKPHDVSKSEQKTHISESGRAPKVAEADRVWIVLDDNDEIPPGGQFIGVNGVGYMLMPGTEAFVPRAVCEVLDHAIKLMPVQDKNTHQIIGWKPRKRFPYSVVNKREEAAAT